MAITPSAQGHISLTDTFLPVYDVSDSVAVVVEADVSTTWEALLRADLIEVGRREPLVGVLGALRMLPQIAIDLLHGERPAPPPARMTLRDAAQTPAANGGWVLLGERPEQEIALGMVGRFWRPVIEFATVDANSFAAFAEPGWAKTVYALAVQPVDESTTMLRGVMRTATTDEGSRRRFRRYWTLGVGPGAHLLVNGLLGLVREDAEAHAA